VTGSPQGRVFQPASFSELVEAVEVAFDYRGDVTISLKSGESLSGYLFNRQVRESDSSIEVFPSDASPARQIRYDQIVTIAFTGEDTATGKSGKAGLPRKNRSDEPKSLVSQPTQKREESCKVPSSPSALRSVFHSEAASLSTIHKCLKTGSPIHYL